MIPRRFATYEDRQQQALEFAVVTASPRSLGCAGLERSEGMVEQKGLEPSTPHDANVVLSQLSYCPSEGSRL